VSVASSIGISGISYILPGELVPLEQLAAEGALLSPIDVLRDFGFQGAHVSDIPADELALAALRRLLAETAVDPESVDALFYAGAIPSSHAVATGSPLQDFSYPVARLQYECGLINAATAGVSQTGCTGLMAAIDFAAAHLVANPFANRVICVSADVLPAGRPREIITNVISDGACAVLVQRNATRNRMLASRRISKGYYWDATIKQNEIIAAYFPTGRAIVLETLASIGLTPDDVALIVPHNVSRRSWSILLPLAGLRTDRLFDDNIGRRGHVIAADNFINLKDACGAGRLHAGDRVLLFNFGFGAAWAAMIVEA
jgi:3-oxoacyl-[acyl-carrier-protein] synthase III